MHLPQGIHKLTTDENVETMKKILIENLQITIKDIVNDITWLAHDMEFFMFCFEIAKF